MSALYRQSSFAGPYRTLNVSTPASGPQLIKILVELALLDSNITGTVLISGAIQGAILYEVEDEPEEELEDDEVEERAAPPVVPAAQVDLAIVFESMVTAPLRANTRPSTVAPVLRVIDVSAKIFPTKVVLVPRVAELPTCQKTFHP